MACPGAQLGQRPQLNFYVNVVDDLLRRPEHADGTAIGILLAAEGTPLAISTYTNYWALPDDVRPALPSAGDLAAVVRDARRHQTDR